MVALLLLTLFQAPQPAPAQPAPATTTQAPKPRPRPAAAASNLALTLFVTDNSGFVISHSHNDHTAGLHHGLRKNANLTIYTPVEGAGFNGQTGPALMNLIKRYVASVPDDMRYFGGNPPTENRSEAPWPGARFVQITEPKEVLPEFSCSATRSEVPGTREMNEISLVIKTPKGGVCVVGCSHPGIERLVEAATKINSQLYEVSGGFHLVDIPDDKVTEMVMAFRDKWKIERMAAGHCTGQFAFAELIRVFGPRFNPPGVGTS